MHGRDSLRRRRVPARESLEGMIAASEALSGGRPARVDERGSRPRGGVRAEALYPGPGSRYDALFPSVFSVPQITRGESRAEAARPSDDRLLEIPGDVP